jgi:hypothetical protein
VLRRYCTDKQSAPPISRSPRLSGRRERHDGHARTHDHRRLLVPNCTPVFITTIRARLCSDAAPANCSHQVSRLIRKSLPENHFFASVLLTSRAVLMNSSASGLSVLLRSVISTIGLCRLGNFTASALIKGLLPGGVTEWLVLIER